MIRFYIGAAQYRRSQLMTRRAPSSLAGAASRLSLYRSAINDAAARSRRLSFDGENAIVLLMFDVLPRAYSKCRRALHDGQFASRKGDEAE